MQSMITCVNDSRTLFLPMHGKAFLNPLKLDLIQFIGGEFFVSFETFISEYQRWSEYSRISMSQSFPLLSTNSPNLLLGYFADTKPYTEA